MYDSVYQTEVVLFFCSGGNVCFTLLFIKLSQCLIKHANNNFFFLKDLNAKAHSNAFKGIKKKV